MAGSADLCGFRLLDPVIYLFPENIHILWHIYSDFDLVASCIKNHSFDIVANNVLSVVIHYSASPATTGFR